MDIPKPNFISNYSMFSNGCCGCFNQPKEKTDCYFYHEEQQMGGRIPACNYHGQLGYCPCEDCKKYIKRSDAFKVIKNHVDKG